MAAAVGTVRRLADRPSYPARRRTGRQPALRRPRPPQPEPTAVRRHRRRPRRPDRGLPAGQGGPRGHRPRGRRPGRRPRQDRRRPRRLPLRPRRPPLLHQEQGGQRPLARDHGRRVPACARACRASSGAASTSTTRSRAPTSSRSSARSSSCRCGALLPVGRGQAQGPRGQPRAVGLQPLRQAAVHTTSSSPTPRRCGASRRPRCAPSGPPSASRACRFFSAAKAAFFGNKGNKIKSLIDKFQYPRYGPGQMWEKMTERIEEMGGEVRLETPRHEASRSTTASVVARPHAAARSSSRAAVISSLPLRATVGIADPAAARRGPRGRRRACATATSSPSRSILDGEDLFPDNWIYIHEPDVRRRPHPELPLVEPVDGPRPRHGLRRPGVLLLQGRRPVDHGRRRPRRAGHARARAARPRRGPSRSAAATSCASRSPTRCTTRTTPSASTTIRGVARPARDEPRRRSAATACTATTTPTTRCSARCAPWTTSSRGPTTTSGRSTSSRPTTRSRPTPTTSSPTARCPRPSTSGAAGRARGRRRRAG